MSLSSEFGRGKTALWWKITALDFSGWLEGSQPSAKSLGCRVSPVLVELSCLCLRRWRCRKATFFAARTNMMPGRKMISGGKMNTHASTQRRWTRRCKNVGCRSHLLHRCVLHEIRGEICPTCANNLLDCPRSDFYLFLPPSMQVMEFSKTAYQLTSDFLVVSLTGSWLPESWELVFYNIRNLGLVSTWWARMNQIQLVSCKYRVDIMNMALFCLMFTTECHLYYIYI